MPTGKDPNDGCLMGEGGGGGVVPSESGGGPKIWTVICGRVTKMLREWGGRSGGARRTVKWGQ